MSQTHNSDTRLQALNDWAAQQLNLPDIQLTPLGGDAGFRRYFRVSTHPDYLAVDAPPTTEDTAQFLRVANLLQQHNVQVPQIRAADSETGFLLVENLGNDLVFNKINNDNADSIYQQAIDMIIRMQSINDKPECLAVYDQAFLLREMNLLIEWFIEKLLQYSLNETEKKLINKCFQDLLASTVKQPQGFVHRDFHSRNLMITAEKTLATIDFQGALWGPITYDLASLLRDCYLRWPQEKVKNWALDFYQHIKSTCPSTSAAEFLKWFDWMGLQRHIKVLGIFARLNLRDNKPQYLQDLPLVIRYTLEVCNQYSELQQFAHWFEQNLLPLAKQQHWYRDYQTAGEE
jgi:aminoglycoside/choline kinase family phosphotransferase